MAEDVTLKAGRELDAEVAEKVMGWHQYEGYLWESSESNNPESLISEWKPSTDIAAAWQVVEKMRERAVYVEISPSDFGYTVRAWHKDGVEYHSKEARVSFTHVPAAICRCALAAIDGETKGTL